MLENFRDGAVQDNTLYVAYRSLYAESEPIPNLDIRSTGVGVALIAADPRLNAISVDKLPAPNNLRHGNQMLLRHLMLIKETLDALSEDFDYVLMDSHPDLHDLEKAVMAASDYLVSPVKLDQQSSVAVASTAQAMNHVNDDINVASSLVDPGPVYEPTQFLGAIGMMCREYGEALKYSEQTIYNRLLRTSGMFESYVTEGDGLRQAAQNSCPVYDLNSPNARRQSRQLLEVTDELVQRIEQTKQS